MKKFVLIAILILSALPALCDGTATLIQWPEWTVSSTENLDMGHKHTSFPLIYLLDGNPATTWVFSGLGRSWDDSASGYAITLTRGEHRKPITVDCIWVMNGYNKSSELFLRNNRVTQLKLYINDKFIKTAALSDNMGWHKISIPKQPIKEIKLLFTRFQKGRDNDICISEIALYNGDVKVNFEMPQAVIYTPGSDCGDGQLWCVVNRTGKRLATHDSESQLQWSPNGKYVAGLSQNNQNKWHLWVVDSIKGRVIYDKASPIQEPFDLVWKDNQSFRLQPGPDEPGGKLVKIKE